MTRRLAVVCLAFALVGCAGPPQVPAPIAASVKLWALPIRFDPPLGRAAQLTIQHESGWSWCGEVAPTGGDLLAPEGPASLLLQLDRPVELVVSVAPGMPAVRWPIPEQ